MSLRSETRVPEEEKLAYLLGWRTEDWRGNVFVSTVLFWKFQLMFLKQSLKCNLVNVPDASGVLIFSICVGENTGGFTLRVLEGEVHTLKAEIGEKRARVAIRVLTDE